MYVWTTIVDILYRKKRHREIRAMIIVGVQIRQGSLSSNVQEGIYDGIARSKGIDRFRPEAVDQIQLRSSSQPGPLVVSRPAAAPFTQLRSVATPLA